MKLCPQCGEEILKIAKKCKHCQSMLVGGASAGRRRARTRGRVSSGASGQGTKALIFGILSLVICAPIFGPMAIISGNSARTDPNESTTGTIGLVLGVISVLFFVLAVLVAVAGA